MTDVEPELGEVHPARAHRRRRLLVVLAVIAVMANVSIAGWYYTQPDPLTPWAPLDQPTAVTLGCMNVNVPGLCLPYETVGTYPDLDPLTPPVPARYPTMHVPLGGPFPSYTAKTERSTSEPIATEYEVWTQLVVPVDGTYDHQTGQFDLPKGRSNYAPIRRIGPEQQARVEELYAQGVPVTVWQLRLYQTPLNAPAGSYPVGRAIGSDNYAIVYGG